MAGELLIFKVKLLFSKGTVSYFSLVVDGGQENLGARPKISISRLQSSSAAVGTDAEASSRDTTQVTHDSMS